MGEALTLHARAHAVWSMSANARNMRCPGALTLGTLCAGETSEAAAWGTCCHEIAERALRTDGAVSDRLGETIETDGFEFEVDDEMVDCAVVYVDYVRQRAAMGGVLLVEQHMSLAAIEPPFEAGGTADAVIVSPVAQDVVDLEVVDLKGGKGVVVEALGNAQARGYGLCAALKFSQNRVRNITVTIVQPRAPHGDGAIRSETFDFADLIDWTATLRKAMDAAKRVQAVFPGIGSGADFTAWAAEHLKTGQCGFCDAKGICPAYRNQALAIAGDKAAAWFEDPSTALVPPAPASELAPERAARILDGLEALSDWIKAFAGHWHARAEKGVDIPGWMLVPKIGNRKWINTEFAPPAMRRLGIDPAIYTEPKSLRSVAQVEKKLGKRGDLIKNLWVRPVKGTNLVKRGSTKREEVKSKAEAFFEKTEDGS